METRRQLGEIPGNLEPVETLEQDLALFERVGMPARDLALDPDYFVSDLRKHIGIYTTS
jgi:hypothetical protein